MPLPPRYQTIHIGRIEQARMCLIQIRHPKQPHTRLQLILLNLNHMLYALLPIAQTIQKRSPNPHSSRAKMKCFDDIRSSCDTTINIHLDLLKHLWADFMQIK